jgi:uncharacterized metal-binding protein YceD (DUF177 family)
MANPLLDRVLPHVLAERSQTLEINGKVGDLGRMAEIVEQELGGLSAADRPRGWQDQAVDARLDFEWLDRDRGLPAVRGRLSTRIAAVCQRCLEVFELPVETEFRLVFVREGDSVSGGQETWELTDDSVRPLDFLEEAGVMALPLSPKHESADDCGPLAGSIGGDSVETVRPFADLRAQMEEQK